MYNTVIFCAKNMSEFCRLGSKPTSALLLCLFFADVLSVAGKIKVDLPSEVCQNVSEIEIRFRNYYAFYLSREAFGVASSPGENKSEIFETHRNGIFADNILRSARACCPNLTVNFVWIGGDTDDESPISAVAQRDIFQHYFGSSKNKTDPNKFVFYFPEFSTKGATQVYGFPRPFLSLLKSPGHAVVMLTSDAMFGLSPNEILKPSLPLLALMFASAIIFGIMVWFLETWNNKEEFPRPFIRGVFEGLWWAVVTMTTVGYGDKAPKNAFARFFTIVWMLSSYILLSLVAANTTSIVATQHLGKIENTVGLKIGTMNSKKFVESEMSLGADIKDFNDTELLVDALLSKDIDRLLVPHYIHFLMVTTKVDVFREKLYVAKVLDQPFQVGLVLAQPYQLTSIPGHEYFYYCFSSFSQRESFQSITTKYSEIKDRTQITPTLLDTTKILELSKVLAFSVGALIALGLICDLWTLLRQCFGKRTELKTTSWELNHLDGGAR